jgi:hypothetical protein
MSPPITIERTSKTVKFALLCGWALLVLGLIFAINDHFAAAAFLMAISVPWIIVTKIVRWWVNG